MLLSEMRDLNLTVQNAKDADDQRASSQPSAVDSAHLGEGRRADAVLVDEVGGPLAAAGHPAGDEGVGHHDVHGIGGERSRERADDGAQSSTSTMQVTVSDGADA